MKKLTILILMFCAHFATAQTGIKFFEGSYAEALEKARNEGKLIFIDFYTQWCGPCKIMDEEVYPVPVVGEVYNKQFVNLKIDAEEGEGIELAHRFKIGSFPTFTFVDPESDEVVHRSGSRQSIDDFIYTAESAITPELTSTSLDKEFKNGNTSIEFYRAYCRYLSIMGNSNQLNKVVNTITAQPDFTLESEFGWEVFEKYIKGFENKHFKSLLMNKNTLESLYGKATVETKMFKEFRYCNQPELIQRAPEFVGKEYLWRTNLANQYIRAKQYEKASAEIEILMDSSDKFQDEFYSFLQFITRTPLYKDFPVFWETKCLEYAQYIAYNHPDRKDASIHFTYASLLEKNIRRIRDADMQLPTQLAEKPVKGKAKYSIRGAGLKPKPKKDAK